MILEPRLLTPEPKVPTYVPGKCKCSMFSLRALHNNVEIAKLSKSLTLTLWIALQVICEVKGPTSQHTCFCSWCICAWSALGYSRLADNAVLQFCPGALSQAADQTSLLCLALTKEECSCKGRCISLHIQRPDENPKP